MKSWMGLVAGLAAAPALGGTVWFNSPQAAVMPGEPVFVDVSIETSLYNEFRIAAVVIGSDAATGFAGFAYAAEWLAEFGPNAYSPDYALSYYTSAQLRVGGDSGPADVSFDDALIDLGSFSIVTAGLAPGVYTIGVDNLRDDESQVIFLEGSEGDPVIDPLFGTFTFTVTPEPGALALLALGAVALRRRS